VPAVLGAVRCGALVGSIRRPIGVEACTRCDKLANRLRAVTHQSRDADLKISSNAENPRPFRSLRRLSVKRFASRLTVPFAANPERSFGTSFSIGHRVAETNGAGRSAHERSRYGMAKPFESPVPGPSKRRQRAA